MHRLKTDTETLFCYGEFPVKQNQQVSKLAVKLDAFANLLEFTPYNNKGKFMGKMLPVSHDKIQAVLTICPNSAVCIDAGCQPQSLLQTSRPMHIPLATVIKEDIIYQDVPVLMGKCPQCEKQSIMPIMSAFKTKMEIGIPVI